MQKDLTISTASVEIHVLRVDGHKMTKATFNQIPELARSEFFVDDGGEFYQEGSGYSARIGWEYSNFDVRSGIKVLGKVNAPDCWYLLCERNGRPVRRFLGRDNRLKEDHAVTEVRVFVEDESIPQLYIAT